MRIIRPLFVMLICLFAFIAPTTATARVGPDKVLVGDAWIDIVCSPSTNQVTTKAWGVQHPRNLQIWVEYTIYINGEFWLEKGTAVYTTSTGSWSIPTEYRWSYLDGDYAIFLSVTNYATGAYLNSDADSCSM